mmetsp:Transcript_18615/g.37767  ORF Transcript_18615/g.37767 Transcript_18615/m.37767 type:complete len:364 (-) Transcript_18615:83-1174(-)
MFRFLRRRRRRHHHHFANVPGAFRSGPLGQIPGIQNSAFVRSRQREVTSRTSRSFRQVVLHGIFARAIGAGGAICDIVVVVVVVVADEFARGEVGRHGRQARMGDGGQGILRCETEVFAKGGHSLRRGGRRDRRLRRNGAGLVVHLLFFRCRGIFFGGSGSGSRRCRRRVSRTESPTANPRQIVQHSRHPRLHHLLQPGRLVRARHAPRPRPPQLPHLPIDQLAHGAKDIVIGIPQAQHGVGAMSKRAGRLGGFAFEPSDEPIGVFGGVGVSGGGAEEEDSVFGGGGCGGRGPDVEAFFLVVVEGAAGDGGEVGGGGGRLEGGLVGGGEVFGHVFGVAGGGAIQDVHFHGGDHLDWTRLDSIG